MSWRSEASRRNLLVSCLTALALLLASCRSATVGPVAPFDPLSLGPAGAVLKKFLERPMRKEALVMKSRFEASIPNMNKQGVMETECRVQANGHISYEMKSYQGDNTIKKEVIARYISGVQDSSTSTASGSVNILPQNYRFKYKRSDTLTERSVEVFELTPRRSAIGLFKGELWVDQETGLPLRMTGRFVKNPSVVFKAIDFTQDFIIQGERNFESVRTIDSSTRLVGKVKMVITSTEHKVVESAKETKTISRASRN